MTATGDLAAIGRSEFHRIGHRRLDEKLKATDLRLQNWAYWAKPRYKVLGYPAVSVTEKANEGGILARNVAPYPPEWPRPVVEVESFVCRFPLRHLAAIMTHYFHLSMLQERRVELFAIIVRQLGRLRPHDFREMGISVGEGAYRHDLDRARWVLRAKLGLDAEDHK